MYKWRLVKPFSDCSFAAYPASPQPLPFLNKWCSVRSYKCRCHLPSQEGRDYQARARVRPCRTHCGGGHRVRPHGEHCTKFNPTTKVWLCCIHHYCGSDSCCSFYPIFPVPFQFSQDVNLDVSHWQELSLDEDGVLPDVLIVPSRLKHFSKVGGALSCSFMLLTLSSACWSDACCKSWLCEQG